MCLWSWSLLHRLINSMAHSFDPLVPALLSLLDVTAWCCVDLREFSRNYDQMAIQRWHGRSSWNSSDKQVGLGWYKGNALSPNEAHQVIAPWTPQESLHVPLFFRCWILKSIQIPHSPDFCNYHHGLVLQPQFRWWSWCSSKKTQGWSVVTRMKVASLL